MPIQYSRLIPVSCAWHSSFPHDRWSCCCQQRLYFLFRDSEARPGFCEASMKPDPCSLLFWYIACFHHDLYRTLSQQHTLPLFLFFFIIIRKISCLLEKQISSAPFFPLASHNPVMLASCSSCLPFSAHLPFLVLISSPGPILLPLVLLSLLRTIDLRDISGCSSRRHLKERRGRVPADITASPSIHLALLICCSACNTAHVGDLYLASSNSSVCLVSFQMVVISACSWSSHPSFLLRKFHPPLVMVSRRPGSRHTVRPFIVMILVSSTRSSHTCDESGRHGFWRTTCSNLLVQEPSLSTEWHDRTNRAVFTWQEPRWKGGTVSYEDWKSTWNSGVRKAIRRGSVEEEVRKHRDRLTGAWKQISKQRRRVNV